MSLIRQFVARFSGFTLANSLMKAFEPLDPGSCQLRFVLLGEDFFLKRRMAADWGSRGLDEP
jgi:hypothetical protein